MPTSLKPSLKITPLGKRFHLFAINFGPIPFDLQILSNFSKRLIFSHFEPTIHSL